MLIHYELLLGLYSVTQTQFGLYLDALEDTAWKLLRLCVVSF